VTNHLRQLKPVHTKVRQFVAENSDCRRSHKSATVAEFRRCLAVFDDSRTFLRQCGQGFTNLSVYYTVIDAGLEWSARVSENCNVLVHIRAATDDRPPSTVFLLHLVILGHHRHFNFIDFSEVPV